MWRRRIAELEKQVLLLCDLIGTLRDLGDRDKIPDYVAVKAVEFDAVMAMVPPDKARSFLNWPASD